MRKVAQHPLEAQGVEKLSLCYARTHVVGWSIAKIIIIAIARTLLLVCATVVIIHDNNTTAIMNHECTTLWDFIYYRQRQRNNYGN